MLPYLGQDQISVEVAEQLALPNHWLLLVIVVLNLILV